MKGAALRALGLRNVARVAWYRVRLRTGTHPAQRLHPRPLPAGEFFDGARTMMTAASGTLPPVLTYFGWHPMSDVQPPDWHRNFLSGAHVRGATEPWWKIGDFDPQAGDIKAVWEASRFDWVVHFALRANGGDRSAVATLNRWLRDWAEHNPAYAGPNWKCGQEASIRVMHLAVAALMLHPEAAPSDALAALLEQHLERIAPTISYAIGQDNNHGTSEAAALLIGGSWLSSCGVAGAERWHATGRALLAERAARLVADDGSFSQYSVNYHRLMLDTLTLAEVWRRARGLEPLDPAVHDRAARATRWLHGMADAETGDAPNIGANDGANLLPITASAYRDHRPSVHLASAVWLQAAAYPAPGAWHAALSLLAVPQPTVELPPAATQLHADGGYAVLRRPGKPAVAVVRFPRYKFRPSHADPLHVDLWVDHRNVLRDGGSFGYAAEARWQDYFAGIESHNTVQFDAREPMPRLGRFLWGAWLETTQHSPVVECEAVTDFRASYRDWRGALHERRVSLGDRSLTVVDHVDAFATRAVLRWRLAPSAWRLEGRALHDGHHTLTVSADVPLVRIEIVHGWESREYLRKTDLPVVEIEVAQPGIITTVYSWAQ